MHCDTSIYVDLSIDKVLWDKGIATGSKLSLNRAQLDVGQLSKLMKGFGKRPKLSLASVLLSVC
eukprot:3514121-Lingulodinium_polyedra.AAC.1